MGINPEEGSNRNDNLRRRRCPLECPANAAGTTTTQANLAGRNFYMSGESTFSTAHKHAVNSTRHSVGSLCYGYKSVTVIDPSHAELRGLASIVGYKLVVDEPEADTIRRIFRLFADGWSVSEIAGLLDRGNVPAPRAGTGWPGSGVWRTLKNEKYIGKRIWRNTPQSIHPETGKTVTPKNLSQMWICTEVPDLRLIPDDLWMQVQERLKAVKKGMKRRRVAELNPAKSAVEAA